MRAPAARVASFGPVEGSPRGVELFSASFASTRSLAPPGLQAYIMTDQSVSFKDRRGMVVNPKTTGKRGAAGVGQGAARRDAGAVRREKRRAAILAAALEEFAARGFASTGLDDVASLAHRKGQDLSLLPRQGEPVPGTRARDAEPAGGHDRGGPVARSAHSRSSRDDRRRVRERNLRHAPQGRDPADHRRRAAVSQARRGLLSRGHRARAAGHPRAARVGGGTRRTPPRRARPFSAIAGRARPRRHHMERLVRALGSTRHTRPHARAPRCAVRGKECDMRGGRFALALLATLLLAGCDNGKERTFQGWVEAELIFVGPDESGRVETLTVREGDPVERGMLLFTIDPDLQLADVAMQEAAVKNAQQAYARAQQLLKTQAGTQKTLDDAEAALRTAQARLNSAQTRLARRKVFSPVTGSVQQIYYRGGELVPAGKPILALLPPGNLKVRFFVNEATLPQLKFGDPVTVTCDGCERDITAKISFISRTSEFTPPVIYSMDERSKLVFLIEARPERPERLRVGQPVSVALGQGQ